jgi:hypothetical protein
MDCSMGFMAKKFNVLKISQEVQARAHVTDRCPPAHTAALCLMQVRPSRLKLSQKRRLPVAVDGTSEGQIPQDIKIRHVG